MKNFEKIRFTLDGSGNNPSWYLDRVKLQCLSQEISYSFEVRKWLSTTIDPYQMCVEIPVSNPGSELPSSKYIYPLVGIETYHLFFRLPTSLNLI